MSVLESIASAISSVMANKMRSVLTMLGIIIGIAAVIMITSIGQGFQNSLNSSFESLGMAGLEISVRSDGEIREADLLTMEDVELIRQHPDVVSAAPLNALNGQIRLKNPTETSNAVFMGSTEAYRDVQALDVRYGRFLAELDVTNESPVIVIDTNLAREIFGRSDVVGETIHASLWFGSAELTVIGVYRSEDFGMAMFEMPYIVYLPVTTLMKLGGSEYVDYIYASGSDRERLDLTAAEIAKLLSLKHRNEKKYNVSNIMQQMDTISGVLGSVTTFVGLVAAISLIVGGIGVMNIMLVTVTERTREIGIRKSLGATDGNIQMQFLIEAVILTAIGGFIGILLGYFGGFAIGNFVDFTPSVDIPTVIMTVAVSSVIGIIFGVYPAGKAARLDPIEALRYE
ncbi:MAG: ABC transporter permease [Clostridiales bacterium]|nr:ABC transporter permease [Clostridiales bacterium]